MSINTIIMELKKLEKIRDNTNNPKLKASLNKKIAILKGDKTVLK